MTATPCTHPRCTYRKWTTGRVPPHDRTLLCPRDYEDTR